MAEQFAVAAARHFSTAEILENANRLDDAAYHYGVVGETSIKEGLFRATGQSLRGHLNDRKISLQQKAIDHLQKVRVLALGRQGGDILNKISSGILNNMFRDWSINIRYHDTDHCPVTSANLARWKQDAIALFNGGAF